MPAPRDPARPVRWVLVRAGSLADRIGPDLVANNGRAHLAPLIAAERVETHALAGQSPPGSSLAPLIAAERVETHALAGQSRRLPR